MSTTTTTHETVSTTDEPPTTDREALATIVAQTTSTVDDLPDWEVYNAACKAVLGTIERVVTELDDDEEEGELDDVEDEDGRTTPRRSEPADFGHGESAGVQDL